MKTGKLKTADKRLIIYFACLLVVVTLLRIFVFDTYLVSQYSMSNTLLDGDKVLVNKWAHNHVRRNDIVVFGEGSDSYIKRCVAVPGDTIEIRKDHVFVNGREVVLPQNALVKAASYFELADPVQLDGGKQFDLMVYETYGHFWSYHDLGPLVIPGKGITIPLTRENRRLYRKLLLDEQAGNLGDTTQPESFSRPYQFRENYYFMMGDNRLASRDSRAFGPVAEKRIIGTTALVLYSKTDFFHSGRLFKSVH